ncbi:MAG: ABC transporter, partial [Clostridiaceae bacterium]|nr:ABC transporter [Clostridiaceae bacterium]
KKPTRLLSLGERMKCEFIMAMLHNPEIVFLDEPTIGLDVIAKDKIREFILEMNSQGVTFILTTHDLGDIERLTERVIVINHGETVFDNSIDALRSHLGTKKAVSITTSGPLPILDIPGVEVKNRLSEYSAELELDVSLMELNRFIDYINRNSTLSDMSLQELPIEEVIKDLYSGTDKNTGITYSD